MSGHSNKKVEDLKKVLEGKKKIETTPPVPRATETEETPPELQELQTRIQSAEEEAKQHYDKLLRVMAEFENYKKRIARDHEDRVKYSHESLLKELLPVMDDFDRVLEHLPTESSSGIQNLTEGIQLIHRHFLTAMKKFGLEEIPTKDQVFDPHFHEALAQVEKEEAPSGQIVESHRKGYRIHDRLLRPALVTVAKAKETNDF